MHLLCAFLLCTPFRMCRACLGLRSICVCAAFVLVAYPGPNVRVSIHSLFLPISPVIFCVTLRASLMSALSSILYVLSTFSFDCSFGIEIFMGDPAAGKPTIAVRSSSVSKFCSVPPRSVSSQCIVTEFYLSLSVSLGALSTSFFPLLVLRWLKSPLPVFSHTSAATHIHRLT